MPRTLINESSQEVQPEINVSLDSEFLQIVNPPSTFESVSPENLNKQSRNHFFSQCKKFLQEQRSFYELSKKVECTLETIVQSGKNDDFSVQKKDIEGRSSDSGKNKMTNETIWKELDKNYRQRNKLQSREKTLSMMCQLISLEKFKHKLKLEDHQGHEKDLTNGNSLALDLKLKKMASSSSGKQLGSSEHIQEQISEHLINEQEYLLNLSEVYQIVLETRQIVEFAQEKQYPLIVDILSQLYSLYIKSVERALSPEMLTPKMVQLILTNKEYRAIFLQEKMGPLMKYSPKDLLEKALVSNRVQHYRLTLNPLINNLNYASNVIDLYESILDSWIQMIKDEATMFRDCQQTHVVRNCTKQMLSEALPKLQKNIYKIKEMSEIAHIRQKIYRFLQQLNSLEVFQGDSEGKSDKKLTHSWEPLPSMIEKMKVLLEAKIQEQTDKLSGAKYNIYSLTSYLPIREYLEAINICIKCDFEREGYERKELPQDEPLLEWEEPFYKLAVSRKPQNQPNNKSLVIFNLNIWYLYLKIVKGAHETTAVDTMIWCKEKFVQMNVGECSKVYYASMDRVLELCGNIAAFRNVLYAEVSLLGHEDLRREVSLGIRDKYLNIYQSALESVGKAEMDNQQVKEFCRQNNINLNKFGKNSNQICIYSLDQISDLIAYA